jgi:monovalent cation:H+ antiporter, CPA1 family
LAVVAAGLASGQIGPRGMSPTTRIVVFNFWEYAAFIANSFIFLIIGLQMDWNLLASNLPAIAWAILAVLAARAVTIYSLSSFGKGIPLKWRNILFWGGLRGAISLALALSLSPALPQRTQLQAMAFGVVFFTLIVEGLTMKPLVRVSGLIQVSPARLAYEKQYARSIALQSSLTHLNQMYQEGLISQDTWDKMKPTLDRQAGHLAESIHQILKNEPDMHEEELADAWREVLRSQRSTLNGLFRDKVISENVFEELAAEVDFKLFEPGSPFPDQEENKNDGEDDQMAAVS